MGASGANGSPELAVRTSYAVEGGNCGILTEGPALVRAADHDREVDDVVTHGAFHRLIDRSREQEQVEGMVGFDLIYGKVNLDRHERVCV